MRDADRAPCPKHRPRSARQSGPKVPGVELRSGAQWWCGRIRAAPSRRLVIGMSAGMNADVVVVGADGSWQSRRAVEAATLEAARRGMGLLLLTVERAEEDALELARVASKSAVLSARRIDPAVPLEVAVLRDLEVPELDRIVERTHLLVLGEHGRGGQIALSIGTTSGDLARRFRTPLLLPRVDRVPEDQAPSRHPGVHVGLSGRDEDGDVLRVAATEARLRGSALWVIRAVPTACPGERVLGAVDEAWATVRSVPETASVPCHVEVVQDDPVTALLARCRSADLLVVGTRGGGTLAGLVMGSVARDVLDRLPCDVIVVPRGVRVRPAAGAPRLRAAL